ncbi:MAG: hypothetical protein ACI8RN_002744 [Glaciecola sp.]|jgi:hypothetical protein
MFLDYRVAVALKIVLTTPVAEASLGGFAIKFFLRYLGQALKPPEASR